MIIGTVRGRVEQDGSPSQIVEGLITHMEARMAADEAARLVGDGLAKVTVSSDRAEKYMGTGHSIFCSVSLTCNQDVDSIREARELALALSMEYLPDMLDMAQEIWAAPEDREVVIEEPRAKAPKRGRRRT